MPELPEVETIAAGLRRELLGQRVENCILNRPDMRFPFPDNLQEVLADATIEGVGRRAKYLLFRLDNGHTLLGHLGMSGTMRVIQEADYVPRKHDHVLWELEDGRLFIFNDPRRFGFLLLCETQVLDAHPLLHSLGVEPLEASFTASYLAKALQNRSAPLKVALMDQKLVVGVGNIYASESLFEAGLSPFMPAHKAQKHAQALVVAIQKTLQSALNSGGSTLRDYVRSDGQGGYFQHHFQVYGREKEPCFRCKQPIFQQYQAGRSTYFCKRCQLVK